MKVSIVIVSWNARDYLVDCLASLSEKACSYPMEIIVVDNASSDGSPEAVERQFPKVKLVRTGSNLGFGKANNIGIRMSNGDYVCLINSDVKVLPDCITTLVRFCEEHATTGMVGPKIIGGDGKLQRSCRGFPTVWNMFSRAIALDVLAPRAVVFGGYLLPHWQHDSIREVDILSGCFWVARRTALEAVGLLDEDFFMYGEDMDWCKRFHLAGWKLMFVPTAEAIHYGGGSSANAPVRFFIEKQRADLQYWSKHHSFLGQQCFLVISWLYHLLRSLGHLTLWCLTFGHKSGPRQKFLRSFKCLQWMFSYTFPFGVRRHRLLTTQVKHAR